MQTSSPAAEADRLLEINARLTARLAGVKPEAWRRRIGDEWSAAEIIGHIIEMESYWAKAAAALAAQPGLEIGRESDDSGRLAGPRGGGASLPREAIEHLSEAGQQAARTLRAIPSAAWTVRGSRRNGEAITVEGIVTDLLTGHAEEHVRQALAALEGA